MAKSRNRKLADLIVTAGVDIAGNVTFDGGSTSADLTFADGDKANFGASSDLQIYHDGSASYIEEKGTGSLYIKGTQLRMQATDGTTYLEADDGGALTIKHSGATKLATTSYGVDITGRLVTTSHIDAPDSARIRLGDGDDLQFYHDGSTSYINDTGTGGLDIRSNELKISTHEGETMAVFSSNAAVSLRYNNATKLETTSTGVSVTGSVTSTTGFTTAANTRVQSSSGMLFITGAGAIPFEVGVGSEKMRLTSTGLGIGTQNPSTKLTVRNDSASTSFGANNIITIQNANTTDNSRMGLAFTGNTGIGSGLALVEAQSYDQSAGHTSLNFSVYNGSWHNDMMVLKAGNVGIGTSSPGRNLSVVSNSFYSLELQGSNAYNNLVDTGIVFSAKYNSSGAVTDIASIRGGRFSTADGNYAGVLKFFTRPNGGSDTERMRVSYDGNVGIGTTAPLALLHLKSTATGSTPTLIFENTNNAQTMNIDFYNNSGGAQSRISYEEGPGAFNFIPNVSTANSAMFINYAGKVGIGTTSPDARLEVEWTGTNVSTDSISRITAPIYPSLEFYSTNTNTSNRNWKIASVYNSYGTLEFLRSSAANGVPNITTLAMKNDGNIGIGTHTPSHKLEVHGTFRTTGTVTHNAANLDLRADDARLLIEEADGTDITWLGDHTGGGHGALYLYNHGGAATVKLTADSHANYINNGNNFGIGTDGPATPLHIKKAGSTSAVQAFIKIENNAGGGLAAGSSIDFHHYHAGGGPAGGAKAASITAQNMATWPGGTPSSYSTGLTFGTLHENTFEERVRISSNGNVVIGNSTYGSSLGQLRVINDAASAPASLSLFGYNNISDDAEFAKIDFASQISGTGGNPTAKIAANIEGVNERAAHLTFHTHNDGGSLQERMRIHSNGNVGIGTASPNSLADLHVADTSDARIWLDATSGNTLELYAGSGTSIFNRSNSFLAFGQDNVERMRINTGGNVGIGNINPGELLSLYKSAGTTLVQAAVHANSTVGFEIKKTNATTQTWRIVDGQTVNGVLEFYDATNSATRMAIKGNGNVGIGTTSPSKILEVSGPGGSGGTIMRLNQKNGSGASGPTMDFGYSGQAWRVGANVYNAGDFVIYDTNATTKMILIKADGNVGIGTNAPAGPLHVDGHTGSLATILEGNGNGDTVPLHFRVKANNNNVTNHGIFGNAGSTGADNSIHIGPSNTSGLSVDAAGKVGIGTSTPQHELVVASTGNTTLGLVGSGYDDAIAIRFGGGDLTNALGNGNSGAAIISQQAVASGQAKGDLRFQINTGDQLDTAMFISNAGKVGIGTASPGYPLEISGAGTVSLAYQRTGTGVTARKWGFHSDNSNTYWQNITDNLLAVTVSNAGNVLVGYTAKSGNEKFGSRGDRAQIATTNSNYGKYETVINANFTGGQAKYIRIQLNGGNVQAGMRVHASGNYSNIDANGSFEKGYTLAVNSGNTSLFGGGTSSSTITDLGSTSSRLSMGSLTKPNATTVYLPVENLHASYTIMFCFAITIMGEIDGIGSIDIINQ